MSEYLCPNNNSLTIEEKCNIFAVKNRMVDIPANFSSKLNRSNMVNCCGEKEDMEHIYNCCKLNESENVLKYDKLFNGSLDQQIEVYRKFQINLLKRKETEKKNVI